MMIFVQGLPNLVPIDEDDYYDWDEEPVETEEEQTELTDSIDYMKNSRKGEKNTHHVVWFNGSFGSFSTNRFVCVA